MRLSSHQLWTLCIIGTLSVSITLYSHSNNINFTQQPAVVKIMKGLSKIQESLSVPSHYSILDYPSDQRNTTEQEQLYPVPFQRRYNESGCYTRKPVVGIAPWHRVKHSGKWHGLRLPIIVMSGAGNIGNVMGNYATAYALGRAYNCSVLINQRMHKQFQTVFPNATIPPYNGSEKDLVGLPFLGRYVYGNKEAAAAGLLGPKIFFAWGTPLELELFHAYSCELRKELTFHPDILEEVNQFWKEKKDFVRDAVRVGFHIRRSDYVSYVRGHGEIIPNETYYNNAMKFYKDRFSKVVFVLASDDKKYIRNVFANYTDVIYVPGTNRYVDMAILNSCDHSIMTVGTFGFWTAYLAGGYVVYPGGFHIPNYPMQGERYKRANMEYFVPVSRSPS